MFLTVLAGEDKWQEVQVDSVLEAAADLLTAAITIGESRGTDLQKVRKNTCYATPFCAYRYRYRSLIIN